MCSCPAHRELVGCVCQCDHSNDRLGQWKAKARELEAEVATLENLNANTGALEKENQELRDDLDASTRFEIGNSISAHQQWDGSWRVIWPDPDAPGDPARFHPMTENHPDRDAALGRARDVAEEDGG